MLQQERTIIEIGEPNVDILPLETADYFYTVLLTRITQLIQTDTAEKEQPPKDCEEV